MANELYIIRHGLAGEHGSYPDDRQRPLTEEGRHKTEKIARRLHDLGLKFHGIQTSPLVRARQTAEILVDVGLGKTLEESDHLSPGGDFEAWLSWLKAWLDRHEDGRLAIVGHEPDLSNWAERLLWGESKGCIRLKKGGVMGLSLPGSGSPVGQCDLFWLAPPRFLL